MSRLTRFTALIAVSVLAATGLASSASAAGTVSSTAKKTPTSSVSWAGNGTYVNGSGARVLSTQVCDATAPVAGNYVLFVLASTKTIDSATIQFGADAPLSMFKSNGDKKGTSSYKYIYTGSKTLAELLTLPVIASYTGLGTPTFTVSHGCQVAFGGYSIIYGMAGLDRVDYAANCSDDPAVCAADVAAMTSADADGDTFINGFYVDIFNYFGLKTALFDPATFDLLKISNMAFYDTSGTKVYNAYARPFAGGIIIIAWVDDYDPMTLHTSVGNGSSTDTAGDYIQFDYEGVTYRYYNLQMAG